nr:hypothetical protein [Tanacetum cinerariifolium]
ASRNSDGGATITDGAGKIGAVWISGVEVRDYTKVMTGFKVFWVNLRLMVQVSLLKMPIKSFLESLNLMLKVLLDHLLAHRMWHLYNTSSTNEVNTAFSVSTSSGHNSQKEGSSLYTDDLMYSFFANQSSGLQLDHEDLELVNEFELKEMDLKWQVAMISTRLKKFYKKTMRKLHFDAKEPVGFDKSKVECFNCHNTRHFARECRTKGNQDSRRRDAGNTGYKARDNEKRPAK